MLIEHNIYAMYYIIYDVLVYNINNGISLEGMLLETLPHDSDLHLHLLLVTHLSISHPAFLSS